VYESKVHNDCIRLRISGWCPGVEVRRGSFEAGTVPCTDCAAACTGSEVGDSTVADGADTVAGKDRHLRPEARSIQPADHVSGVQDHPRGPPPHTTA